MKTIEAMCKYSDWANAALLDAAKPLNATQLDTIFDIGMGTIRKSFNHIISGENVWLQRCKGHAETKWPPANEPITVAELRMRANQTIEDRTAFFRGLKDTDLDKRITYRDSLGGLFTATLREMLIQLLIHSIHHRAQAVNILRRLGLPAPEVDFMMSVRVPA
ncbi:MAG: DinB family protein [Planctomycetes bacterium]|nr:DinB family protein [Planctomycetota bacterium]